jgi:hypothetical protein
MEDTGNFSDVDLSLDKKTGDIVLRRGEKKTHTHTFVPNLTVFARAELSPHCVVGV